MELLSRDRKTLPSPEKIEQCVDARGMPRASTHCSIFSGDGKVFRSRLKSSIGARVVTRRRSPGTREEHEEERAPTVVPAGNAYFYYRRKSGEVAQNYGIRITISTET